MPQSDSPRVRYIDQTGDQAVKLRRRYRRACFLKWACLMSIALILIVLLTLFVNIALHGSSSFTRTLIRLDVFFDSQILAPEGDILFDANYRTIAHRSLHALFPEVKSRSERIALGRLLGAGAEDNLRQVLKNNPSFLGQQVSLEFVASDHIDLLRKGSLDRNQPEDRRVLKNNQIGWYDALKANGRIRTGIDWTFLTAGNSREPELAGIGAAVVASMLTMIVTLLVAFPISVATAVYLEEFAPKNWLTRMIEIAVNNLAAVPSIVFGLLGLAILLGFFNFPRSTPLVGGIILALIVLPTIIIAARTALSTVPSAIIEGALALGASPTQVVLHHKLPLAMPGILTGTIISMAQSLGETAPLLAIGMIAFVVDIPTSFMDVGAPLPVQIFLWSDAPERAFVHRTYGAILALLVILLIMNLSAILLRQRLEKRLSS